MSSSTTTNNDTKYLDILIIGAGFGGCYSLHKLRQLNFKVHVFEASSYLGGVWNWNTYPGSRCDSDIPYYQFSMPEVWRKWNWSERFPSGEELREYFKHVDETLALSKDITYDAKVIDAAYDEEVGKWTVKTENGSVATCKYLLCATGSSFKPYIPTFKNLERFQGQLIHSARWPKDVKTKGSRVAIIGSGASAVGCTQELAKSCRTLTVYIRTPAIALPMFQRPISEFEQRIHKGTYRNMFANCRKSSSGLPYDSQEGSLYSLSDAEREEFWEELWNRGGLGFNVSNYQDFFVDPKASAMMYDFWARKTRSRMTNAGKAAILVPEKAPFAFGTKRSSLEQDYYECLDRENVDVVNLKTNPIMEFTEKGIVGDDGVEREFDVVVMATGFDAITGSITSMNVRGRDGVTLKERWKDGVFTHLGLCSSGCPNLFMVYGPQAPTPFSNAPVFIESQVDIIIDFILKMERQGILSIEAERGAEEKWKKVIQNFSDQTLLPSTDSWYNGANIPGKKREQLIYLSGIVEYERECREALKTLEGFTVVHDDSKTVGVAKQLELS